MEIDLDEEDHTAVDPMERDLPANLVGSHTVIDQLMEQENHMEKENHEEINQPLVIENQQEPQDHMVISQLMEIGNQQLLVDHLEISLPTRVGQEHLVFHELVQPDQVDQAPHLVDQDQIGRKFHTTFPVEARFIASPKLRKQSWCEIYEDGNSMQKRSSAASFFNYHKLFLFLWSKQSFRYGFI